MTTRFENIKTDLNELENEGLIKNEALIKIYGMVQEMTLICGTYMKY